MGHETKIFSWATSLPSISIFRCCLEVLTDVDFTWTPFLGLAKPGEVLHETTLSYHLQGLSHWIESGLMDTNVVTRLADAWTSPGSESLDILVSVTKELNTLILVDQSNSITVTLSVADNSPSIRKHMLDKAEVVLDT